jgi:hypothetical protein
MTAIPHPSSFRDPAGFLYNRGDRLLRQVNREYAEDLEHLRSSGLLDESAAAGLTLRHEEVALADRSDDRGCAVFEPTRLSFVAYPYEWCPGQLRDAGLATIALQRRALARGMTLKDATAYNVQFHEGRPVHIDLLSFARVRAGRPWVAYRQYCQHFVAPLALARYRDPRLLRLLTVHLDGVPLDVASRLLPARTWLRPSLFVHIHAHALVSSRVADGAADGRARVRGTALVALADSLERCVRSLAWRPPAGVWRDYTSERSYSDAALSSKRSSVERWLARGAYRSVLDAGANVGEFSRLAAGAAERVLSVDADYASVETLYRSLDEPGRARILPLVADLASPSPALGWNGSEREPLLERLRSDVVLALALVHHLVLTAGAPVEAVVALLARLGTEAVVEYVPMDDPQARRLLRNRDSYHAYDRSRFEAALRTRYSIAEVAPVGDSSRVLYRLAPAGSAA